MDALVFDSGASVLVGSGELVNSYTVLNLLNANVKVPLLKFLNAVLV